MTIPLSRFRDAVAKVNDLSNAERRLADLHDTPSGVVVVRTKSGQILFDADESQTVATEIHDLLLARINQRIAALKDDLAADGIDVDR
jgi:hypothetical protein